MITAEDLDKCSLSRLEIAQKAGMTYSALTRRLGGYTQWGPEQSIIRRIISDYPKEEQNRRVK